jgi:hypothetical protein
VKTLLVLAAGKAMDAARSFQGLRDRDVALDGNQAIDPGCRSWVSLTRPPLASTIRTHDRRRDLTHFGVESRVMTRK